MPGSCGTCGVWKWPEATTIRSNSSTTVSPLTRSCAVRRKRPSSCFSTQRTAVPKRICPRTSTSCMWARMYSDITSRGR